MPDGPRASPGAGQTTATILGSLFGESKKLNSSNLWSPRASACTDATSLGHSARSEFFRIGFTNRPPGRKKLTRGGRRGPTGGRSVRRNPFYAECLQNFCKTRRSRIDIASVLYRISAEIRQKTSYALCSDGRTMRRRTICVEGRTNLSVDGVSNL